MSEAGRAAERQTRRLGVVKWLLRGAALVCASLGVCFLVNMLLLRSQQQPGEPLQLAPLDRNKAALRLSTLLSVATVSSALETDAERAPFLELHGRIEEMFPHARMVLEREVIGGASLLLRWRGKDPSLPPLLLLAHQDVVPVEPGTEVDWVHGPFSGDVADGYIWGRGALDDKSRIGAMLEAVELLIASGVRPQRSVYFAFGHDEEIGGLHGAKVMAATLADRHLKFAAILDEGQFIERDAAFGLTRPVAKIGVAEKGYLNVELAVETAGGHSSMPTAETSTGILARAVARIEEAKLPVRLTAPVRAQLSFIAPELPLVGRLALSNLWFFSPFLEWRLAQSPPGNALVRTTMAPTVFVGSVKANVLAKRAHAVVNLRLLPGDSSRAALAHVRAVVNDVRVNIQPLTEVASEPSAVSPTDSTEFVRVQRAVAATFDDAVVAPSLVVLATDARHYQALSEAVFRFSPLTLDAEDYTRLHGINERISRDDYAKAVRFYAHYLGAQ